MSNVKSLKMTGLVLAEVPNHEGLSSYLGKLCHPTFGIDLKYGQGYIKHEGKLMLNYEISGQEAVSTEFLLGLVKDIRESGGIINECDCVDVDNGININLL